MIVALSDLMSARRKSLGEVNAFDKCLSLGCIERLSGSKGVYLIATLGMNAVKVGFTNNLSARLASIQNGNPFPCFVAAFFETEQPLVLEALIQRASNLGLLYGEWYSGGDVLMAFEDEQVDRIVADPLTTKTHYGTDEPFELARILEPEIPRPKDSDSWMDIEPRTKGRPKKYKGLDGAPQVTIRLDPWAYEWLKDRPEGMRATVQDLISERISATNEKGPTP